MLDYFESREDACEEWYYRNVKDGIAKCYCGKEFKFEDGQMASADPYGIPVCPDCFDEICHQDILGNLEGEAHRRDQTDLSEIPPLGESG